MSGKSLKRIAFHTKRLRESKGLTQDELAVKCGRSRRIISWIENEHDGYHPDTSTVEAIADVFKKDVIEFYRPIS